jgi:type IV pilus assembly protein PilV
MPIKKRKTRERGFTLLEVLIAISIFSVGVLAVAAMQGTATRGNRLGNELTQATVLAQQQIEVLKSADTSHPATLASGLPTGNYNDPNNPIDETGQSGGIFTRSWVIAAHTTFSRLVTVTVSWTIGGATHNVVFSTVTRGGGN